MIKFINEYCDFSKRYTSTLNQKYPNVDINIRFVSSGDDSRMADCKNTPFACNPHADYGGFHVVYNEKVINDLCLDQDEICALVAHEIGHIIRKDPYDKYYPEIEQKCDQYSIALGLQLSIASAVIKMKELIPTYYWDARIRSITDSIQFYRPQWTAGRYNIDKHAALYYNLIDGMSYLFEGDSADVVSIFLTSKRNTLLSWREIVLKASVEEASLIDFCRQLLQIGLITNHIFSTNEIMDYRKRVVDSRRKASRSFNCYENSELLLDDAEMAYTNIVGGISSVMFELTYRCSEQCIHCYNIGSAHNDSEVSHRHERVELNFEQYKSIIDQFYEMGMFRVCLTGGDPFSHPNVWSIIDYLYSKNIAFDIFTNGQRLCGREDELASYYPKIVAVSIYSGLPDVHNAITRVAGSYDKSISVMNKLANLAIPIVLKCCVMKTNFDTYQTVYKVAADIPAYPQIEVCVTDSVEGNKYVSQNLRLSKGQYKEILKDERIPLYVGKSGTMKTIVARNSSSNLCKAGIHTFNVTPEGFLVPCCRLHIRVGDLKQEKVSSILANSVSLKKWLSLSIKDYLECGKREYCSFCNVCPGLNFSEHASPLEPAENACFIAKIRYEMALDLNLIRNGNV